MLSSFIHYRDSAMRKAAKTSRLLAINNPKRDQPPSPKSFASPELVEVPGDVPPVPKFLIVPDQPKQDIDLDISRGNLLTTPQSANSLPRVQLEISPGSLSDWFPSHLFNSDKYNFAEGVSQYSAPDVTGVGGVGAEVAISAEAGGRGSGSGDAISRDGSASPDASSLVRPGNANRDAAVINPSTLKSEDAPIEGEGTHQDSTDSSAFSFWRPQPSPLMIPDDLQRAFHNSTTFDLPESVIDDNMSAVSGATLARALIGNSFILSGESTRRRSLARHGFTITRMDSAVLPQGESARFSSSYWRDRRISGGEIVPLSDSGRTSPIPPVPPIPPHLAAKAEQQQPAAPCDEENEQDKLASIFNLGQPSGTSTVGSFLDSYAEDSLENFLSDRQHGDLDLQVLRRISQITEVPGATFPSVPNTPPPGSLGVPTQQSSGSSTYSTQLAPSGKTSKRDSSKSGSMSPPLSTLPVKPSASLHQRTVSEPQTSLSPTSSHRTNHSLGSSESAGTSRNPAPSPPERSENGSISSRPSSPLSTSQWSERWDPRKRQKGNKGILGLTLSPSAPRAKVDWILTRNRSGSLGGETYNPRVITRLPIGERPRSVTNATSPSESSVVATVRPSVPSVAAESSKRVVGQASTPHTVRSPMQEATNPTDVLLVPPNTRNVFNRQRAGSTPSPITITRDSKDLDSYNITVAGGTAGLNGATPTTGRQTFPETPSEFSPVWSAGSVASPFHNELLNFGPSSELSRTMSMSGSGGGVPKPSFAQQVLLNRAATSVRGARHVNNPNRPKVVAPSLPYATMPMLLTPPPEETNSEDGQPSSDNDDGNHAADTVVNRKASPSHSKLSVELAAASGPPSPLSREPSSPSNSTYVSSNYEVPSPRRIPLPASNDSLRQNNSSEVLPEVKPLPPRPPETPTDTMIGGSSVDSSRANGPVDVPIRVPASSSAPVRNEVLAQLPPQSPPIPMPITPPTTTSVPSSPPVPISRTRTPQTPAFPPSTGRSDLSHYLSSFTLSLGAPPPYYSIVPSGGHGEHAGDSPGLYGRNLDGSGHSASPSYPDFRSPATTDASQSPGIDGVLSSGESSFSRNRITRMRPPAGPRNPITPGVLQRNESASSTGSTGYSGGAHTSQRVGYSNASAFVPKFQTPPMKWRGYTMDAAKWTFTSEQLQAIVSRAIKQSAEAYSIRLLRLETLDNDIPDEMHRLEMRGTDVKARYKALSRKRYGLLLSLSAQIEGSSKGDPVTTSRLVGELAEVSATLDHLAEELHSVDEQVANLRSLRDVHSASALAMALRKLNTSFLRQLSETQALRAQVDVLESERDEAWKHAEDVAHEYDDLTEKVLETNGLQGPGGPGGPGGLTRSGSRRSSRVLAVRKSSIRASKAGLRPSRSQRSSISSIYRGSLSPASAGRPTFSADDIPPVPPIPVHTPLGIETAGLQSRSSMGVSTGSPTSETRAMVKAQEELYALLGISPIESGGRRRRPLSLSLSGTPIVPDSSPLPPDSSSRGRRSASRPRSAGSAVLTL